METAKKIYELFRQNPSIILDSRESKQGSLFFGLKGQNTNGGSFARQALENGCSYAIVDQPEYVFDNQCILVKNCLETLQEIARIHRQNMQIPVIGITGSNGKTTTKELIASVLSTEKNVVFTTGNLNNHIGVPLTLLRLTKKTEIAIIEMGANHPGEIDTLCRIAVPTHGLITTIGKAHLEGFGSFEGVVHAKTELYRYLNELPGTIFVHADDPLLMEQARPYKGAIVTYGTSGQASYRGSISSTGAFMQFRLLSDGKTFGKEVDIPTRLIGNYNFPNAMAAACVGLYFGIKVSHIKRAIEQYVPQNNRSQYLKTERNELILDYYNANPSSMEKALHNFAAMQGNNKMLILGDMLELGSYSAEEHSAIIKLAKKLGFNQIILAGDEFTNVAKNTGIECFGNSEQLASALQKRHLSGYLILVKGSHAIHLEKIIPSL